MARGDHIKASRGAYEHHGIDLGDGTAVHFAPGESGSKLIVSRTRLSDFAREDPVEVVPYGQALHPDLSCTLALVQIGHRNYNVLSNNCEHVAVFCKTGKKTSRQAEDAGRQIFEVARAMFIPALAARPAFWLLKRSIKHTLHAFLREEGATEQAVADEQRWVQPLYRFWQAYTGSDGKSYFQCLDGSWLTGSSDGSLEPGGPAATIALSPSLRLWINDRFERHAETEYGWFVTGSDGKPALYAPQERILAPVDLSRPKFLTAPLGAIHGILEFPDSWSDWANAMVELVRRGAGDWNTYQILIQIAQGTAVQFDNPANPALEPIRWRALWTLGVLNRVQHVNVSTDMLPALAEISSILLGTGEPRQVKCAAIQALQLIHRPHDPIIRTILTQATNAAEPDVRDLAERALKGEPFPAEYLPRLGEWVDSPSQPGETRA